MHDQTIKKVERDLFQAVAELAYALAMADGELSEEETIAFKKVIKETLGEGEWLIIRHYDIVKSRIHPDLPASYKHAMHLIRENSRGLSKALIRKFLYVLEKIAEVMGVSELERNFIDQFESEIQTIYQSKGMENIELKMSAELRNLYSSIGQLAYVMARADHDLQAEEIEAFDKVIQENFGNFGIIAKDRFEVLDQVNSPDTESTYEHSIYLIRKNVRALDQSTIQKFMDVMIQVAEVAGIVPEERKLINRFREDIYRIYDEKKHGSYS